MNAKRIKELREMCDQATDGPWQWSDRWGEGSIIGPPDEDGHRPEIFGAAPCEGYISFDDPNTKFTCVARTALPEALDEVERLAQFVKEVQDWGDDCPAELANAAYMMLARRGV